MGLILDLGNLTTGNFIHPDFMLRQDSWVESDMHPGGRLTFRSGLDLPFPGCGTSGLSLYLLSSMRHITDVQKLVKDSVVLIWCKIQSTGPYS